MSCPPDPPTFRLLDALVGWDVAAMPGLAGADDLAGITLAPLDHGIDADALGRALPPARIAKGCDPCRWLLVTCCPPRSRLLRLDDCAPRWLPVWNGPCPAGSLACATAVALHEDLIAVSDPGAGAVRVWRANGMAHGYDLLMAKPGPICWQPHRGWLVADLGAMRLRAYDRSGAEHARSWALPGTADRIGVDTHGTVWLATHDLGEYRLWALRRGENHFHPVALDALLAAFPDTGVRAGGAHGFCIADEVAGAPRVRCFDCQGRPAEHPAASASVRWAKQGQLLTLAIDSGIPRCRWHRVRLDAAVPPGTTVSVAVATNEVPDPALQAEPLIEDGRWAGFEAGLPNPADWTEGAAGALDFAIDQPPGRYLFLRLRLTGDGFQTPRVRRIRLDMPRQTSFDRLPALYADNPAAIDFGERFLALFDAAVEGMDRVVERYPGLFDVEGAPPELLPWLGRFLGVTMDGSWGDAQRRAILKAMPELFRLRGTPEGLARAVELVLGVRPAIREAALERAWGGAGSARIGGFRLFGRSAARFRLGRSGLGGAPVWSIGNADLDPLAAQAWRFDVMLPIAPAEPVRRQVSQMIESQKPAHTLATIRQGAQGLVVGMGTAVGVDTVLVALPAPVLGSAAGVRLSRQSILWSRNRTSTPALRVGSAAVVGVHTFVE